MPVVVGLVVIWTVLADPQPDLPVQREPGEPALRVGRRRRDRAGHRLRAAGRRDRPVGRLGQRPRRARCSASCSSATGCRCWLAILAAVVLGAVIGCGVRAVVQPVRGAELRHHARRPARLPRAAALRARHQGSINLPFDSGLVNFAQLDFVPAWLSYASRSLAARRAVRRRLPARAGSAASAGLSAHRRARARAAQRGVLVVLAFVVCYLNQTRGVGWMFVFFVALVAGHALRC